MRGAPGHFPRPPTPIPPHIHRHTQHSQTYTTFIHPWAPFPDGTRTRADLAVVAERVLIFLPPPYRQPLLDIHTYPWPGGVSFLRKNPPPSVGFEPTSAGTATSEHCLRQPCGHRATSHTRGIFIFGGGNKRLRNVTKMYCQCQICHKRRKKECLGKFKLSLN
jgi:hypothetical protein